LNTKDRGAPKSAGPVEIATFATIVDPALFGNPCRRGKSLFVLLIETRLKFSSFKALEWLASVSDWHVMTKMRQLVN